MINIFIYKEGLLGIYVLKIRTFSTKILGLTGHRLDGKDHKLSVIHYLLSTQPEKTSSLDLPFFILLMKISKWFLRGKVFFSKLFKIAYSFLHLSFKAIRLRVVKLASYQLLWKIILP